MLSWSRFLLSLGFPGYRKGFSTPCERREDAVVWAQSVSLATSNQETGNIVDEAIVLIRSKSQEFHAEVLGTD